MEGILDAGTVVLALGAFVNLVVQLLKMASACDEPWKTVAAAFVRPSR